MSRAHKFYGNFLLCVFKFSMEKKYKPHLQASKKQQQPVESIFELKFLSFSFFYVRTRERVRARVSNGKLISRA